MDQTVCVCVCVCGCVRVHLEQSNTREVGHSSSGEPLWQLELPLHHTCLMMDCNMFKGSRPATNKKQHTCKHTHTNTHSQRKKEIIARTISSYYVPGKFNLIAYVLWYVCVRHTSTPPNHTHTHTHTQTLDWTFYHTDEKSTDDWFCVVLPKENNSNIHTFCSEIWTWSLSDVKLTLMLCCQKVRWTFQEG